MMSKAKKVLVTGADGFIGSRLTATLVRTGYEVKAFVFGLMGDLGLTGNKTITAVSGCPRTDLAGAEALAQRLVNNPGSSGLALVAP